METSNVRRFPNSFSIEHILSKPVHFKSLNNFDNISDRAEPHCENDIDAEISLDRSATISPESSLNEDNIEECKSDVASEDGSSKLKVFKKNDLFLSQILNTPTAIC